ncbi:hypothetical protein TKK_0013407 [Trichogramma kaykai]
MFFQRFFAEILCIAIAYIVNVDGNQNKPTWEQASSWRFKNEKSFLKGVHDIIAETLREKSSISLLDKQVGKPLEYKLFNGHLDRFSIVGNSFHHIRSGRRVVITVSFHWPKLEIHYDYKINEDDEPKKIRCVIEPMNVSTNIEVDSSSKTLLFSKIDFNNGAMEIFMEGRNDLERKNEPNIFRDFEEIISSEITIQISDLWSLVVDRVNKNSRSKYTYDSVIPVDH